MALGDHLAVSYAVYRHHGIDVGDGRVAHYGGWLAGTGIGQVEAVSREKFAQGRPVHLVESPLAFEPREVVARALSRLGERRYSLAANNCEHFAHWCRSGERHSRQVARVLERIGASAAKIVAQKAAQRALRRTAVAATSGPLRVLTPFQFVADAAQLGTEVAASGLGASDEEAESVAQAVGLAASLGVGFAAAGPAGAAFGGGLWTVSEAISKVGAQRSAAAMQALGWPRRPTPPSDLT